jgi:hypothetical protein
MAQTPFEIAKDITVAAIQSKVIKLPDTTSYDKISEFNIKRAEEIASFFNAVYKAIKD